MTIQSLRREMSELKESSSREKDVVMRREQELAEEVDSLRMRCRTLESERLGGGMSDVSFTFLYAMIGR